jgi:hypothetical protein
MSKNVSDLLNVFLSFEGLLDKATKHNKKHPYNYDQWYKGHCEECNALTLDIDLIEDEFEMMLQAYIDAKVDARIEAKLKEVAGRIR